MRPAAPVVVAILLLLAAGPAQGAQTTPTTFGADLATRTPGSDVTCADLYFQATCTLSTSADQLGGTGESFIVPQGPDDHGTGTITAFHVKVGASTGPMQILLFQALRQSANSAACCSVVNASDPFTPAASSTTTIPVQWPTENDNVPNPDSHIYAYDVMAISIGQGVALPVSAQQNAIDTFWAPACPGTVGTECDNYGGDERYVVTMSADWTPDPGSTNPNPNPNNPNPPKNPPAAPSLLAATARGTVEGTRVTVPLSCSTALCIGSVQLQNFKANAATAAAAGSAANARHVTYGKARFDIPAGKTQKVRLELTRAGRALFKHHHRERLWLNATPRGGQALSKRITVRKQQP